MSAIFKKLSLSDQAKVTVLNAPDSFEPELASLEGAVIGRNLEGTQRLTFSLAAAVWSDLNP